MLGFYRFITKHAEGLLLALLKHRVRKGKEDEARFLEKTGVYMKTRPEGKLFWIHAASVGEAQSALILVHYLLQRFDNIHILVTSGTRTSADMMQKNLPERAFHQYYPLDHPEWVEKFLEYWAPDLVFWMESELWPNMLTSIQAVDIPCILVNARLSYSSFKRWKSFKSSARHILKSFTLILAQTEKDALRFKTLSPDDQKIVTTDNLKYSAKPLGFDEQDHQNLLAICGQKPIFLYASSHKGEEELACRTHDILKTSFPDMLTIIVPRHPERRDQIMESLNDFNLNIMLRGEDKKLPEEDTDIYIADTLGELGLFYRLAPIAVIGRSFSDDGGGGHNPIEAAQLHCAVFHGPHVQYQQEIFDEMNEANAAIRIPDEAALANRVEHYLSNPEALKDLQETGSQFAKNKEAVIERVIKEIDPILNEVMA